jgi:hypothetical protein
MTDNGQPGREMGVSWSRLREHEECKQKAYLKASGKKSAVGDIRVYFHGTVVDRCMRNWLMQDKQKPGEMAAMVDHIMDVEETSARESGDGIVKWRSLGDRDHVRGWCKELVTRLEPILYELVIPLDYTPAMRFRTPLVIPHLDGSPQRIWLVGEFDLLTRTRDAAQDFYVWDLKGTADPNYWRKVVGQLLFYDLACYSMFSKYPVGGGLIQPMCERQVLPFTYAPEHRLQVLQSTVSYCHDVWKKDNRPKEGTSGCAYCEVRHACIRYRQPASGRQPWPVA